MRKLNWIDFYLLLVNKQTTKHLKPITTTDTFAGMTKNFHPEGLYSTEIFGSIGRESRDEIFSYIDVKLDIVSPTLLMALFTLKALYEDICSSRKFATWNDKEKDFEPALPGETGADTGYSFFISHLKDLKPKRNASLLRDDSIDFFNKFKDTCLGSCVLVLPAGLRDIQIRQDSREVEDEVNPLYRRLISLARAIPDKDANNKLYDNVRWKLQQTFNEIWEYFFDILNGKGGFTRSKVTKRKVMNSTRNVLSSFTTGSKVMGRDDEVKATDTKMGCYQGLKSLLPVAQYYIKNRYLSNILAGDSKLYGINTKTLKREIVDVPGKTYDLFATDEGVESLINRMAEINARHRFVMIDKDHYVALVYKDKNNFKVFYDIDDLPADKDHKNVNPITLIELLYLSGYDKWNDYFTFVTRYPVAGRGSTYSSTIRLETTIRSEYVFELEDDWITPKEKAASSYPIRSINEFVDSMAVHPSRVPGLQADFDGDTGSGNAVMSNEALDENREWINSREYWYDSTGRFKVAITNDVINRVITSLFKDPN